MKQNIVVKLRLGDIKMELSEILLRCYECGESIGELDLQIEGKKYGITGYFHPPCWEKYQLDHDLNLDPRVRCCDCGLFNRCHQRGSEERHCDPIYCDAYKEKSGNQSFTTKEE